MIRIIERQVRGHVTAWRMSFNAPDNQSVTFIDNDVIEARTRKTSDRSLVSNTLQAEYPIIDAGCHLITLLRHSTVSTK